MVRKFGKSDGQTGSRCLDKAVLAQGGICRSLNEHETRELITETYMFMIMDIEFHARILRGTILAAVQGR